MSSDIAQVNFTARQGSRFERTFTFFEAGPDYDTVKTDKAEQDFTGATAAMQVRLGPDKPAVLSLASGEGISISGGGITIEVDADVLDQVEPLMYQYDLELTMPGAQPQAMVEGTFTVKAGYTR